MSDAAMEMLGIDRSAGPLSVLGLAVPPAKAEAVIAALRARLAEVAAHPEGATPKADEVRVVLHAAAAQALEQIARRSPVRRAAPGPGAAPVTAALESGDAMPFEAQVELALATYGGWNPTSQKWIAVLAQHHGVSPDRLRALMAGMASPAPGMAVPVARKGEPESRPGDSSVFAGLDDEPAVRDPGSAALVRTLGVLGGVVVVIVALSGLLMLLSGGGGRNAAPVPPGPAPVADSTPGVPGPSKPVELFPAEKPESAKPRQDRPQEWADLSRELAACVQAVDRDAGAAEERFAAVVGEMGRAWTRATPDAAVAATGLVVDFLYRLGARPDLAGLAVEAIARPANAVRGDSPVKAEDVAPAVWSAGLLARLSRERELPASATRRVSDMVAEVFGPGPPQDPSFKTGAAAALTRLAGRLTPPAKLDEDGVKASAAAWKSWTACAEAIDAPGSALPSRAILMAIEHLMVTGPEPSQSEATFDAISRLTLALTWRKGDESRQWLLRWVDAPGISAPDLNVVTSVLATKSGAEGVDLSFVLSPTAGDAQRSELRERLATVWGMPGAVSRGELVHRWTEAARSRLNQPPPSQTSALTHLVRAARLAHINSCAARIWAGQPLAPQEMDDDLKDAILNKLGDTGRPEPIPRADPNDSWGVRYANAGQNVGARKDLLGRLPTWPLSAIDAAVLVEEAIRGSPSQVRALASREVIGRSGDPAVCNALLDAAPFLPATDEAASLVAYVVGERLPSPRDPRWKPEVRRALVDRTLRLIAGGSESGLADDLAGVLGDEYSKAVGATTASPAGESQEAPPPLTGPASAVTPEDAARALRLEWQRRAAMLIPSGREPISGSQLGVRRAARESLATGPIQRFHAEQVGLAELMASVVSAEQPLHAAEIATALNEMADRRRAAGHIAEQIEAGEEAMVRLWLIRFGETGS